MEDLKVAAKQGALHLDNIRPGWFVEVDLSNLDLGNCYRCVLGQLWGFYASGLMYVVYRVQGPINDSELSTTGYVFATSNGFNGITSEGAEALTNIWREEILRRLGEHE